MEKQRYPESWYPLCYSDELKMGKLLLLEVFDGELILFRSEEGTPGVVSRHCPHMGSDLSNGTIVKGRLQCPFHHRAYCIKGKCSNIPGSKKRQLGPHLKTFPLKEYFGIIFLYFGSRPKFDFPTFPRVKEKAVFSKALRKKLNTPYSSLLFNGFDTHHLTCIHNREIVSPVKMESLSPFHLGADYSMKVLVERFYDVAVKFFGIKVVDVHLDCWGGNFLIITNKKSLDNILITSVPVNARKSQFFLTTISEDRGTGLLGSFFQKLRLKMTSFLGLAFLRPDELIVEQMKPELRALDPEMDYTVVKFWEYWNSLPKNVL
ncbi:Rieske 2Fe-2S domain-containing protein [Bacteriovoracales bacterium]|nr:Rieske 2Fe-2S domain-containing protein [Bacteriovoracales bacterium]